MSGKWDRYDPRELRDALTSQDLDEMNADRSLNFWSWDSGDEVGMDDSELAEYLAYNHTNEVGEYLESRGRLRSSELRRAEEASRQARAEERRRAEEERHNLFYGDYSDDYDDYESDDDFGEYDEYDDDDDDDEYDDDDDEDDLDEDDYVAPVVKRFRLNVAGINKGEHPLAWEGADSIAPDDIELIREYDNAYDDNAIAVYVHGMHGGYLSRKDARIIAPMLDNGADADVVKVNVGERADELGELFLYAWLTVEVDPAG